jgi:hypothetical protein
VEEGVTEETAMAASTSARHYELPIEHEAHRRLRDDAWIGGPFFVARYYLGKFIGANLMDARQEFFDEQLNRCAAENLPKCPWLKDSHCYYEAMNTWLQHRYRQFDENQRYPIREATRDERAVVLILESPELTDDEIRIQLNTTAKQVQRLTLFHYVRREQRRLAGSRGN